MINLFHNHCLHLGSPLKQSLKQRLACKSLLREMIPKGECRAEKSGTGKEGKGIQGCIVRGSARGAPGAWSCGGLSEELLNFFQIVHKVTKTGNGAVHWFPYHLLSEIPHCVGVNSLTLPGLQRNASEWDRRAGSVPTGDLQDATEKPGAEGERSVGRFRGGDISFHLHTSGYNSWMNTELRAPDPGHKRCLTQLQCHCHS